jgi:hypothetical protein
MYVRVNFCVLFYAYMMFCEYYVHVKFRFECRICHSECPMEMRIWQHMRFVFECVCVCIYIYIYIYIYMYSCVCVRVCECVCVCVCVYGDRRKR